MTAAQTRELCSSSEQIGGQPKQRPSSLSLASLSQPSSLDSVVALIQPLVPLLYLPEQGKSKTCSRRRLSSSGKSEQDHDRLCIRCCIASTAWILLYSSLLVHCHETGRGLRSLSEENYLLSHP